MVSYRKKSHKTQKRRRSKKGGDETKNDTWDIEMGPRSESPVHLVAAKDADDMEKGLTKFSPVPNKPGDEQAGGKRRRGNKSKKHYKKISMSKTHKGRKKFHRRGHRQTKRQGKKSKSLLSRIFGL